MGCWDFCLQLGCASNRELHLDPLDLFQINHVIMTKLFLGGLLAAAGCLVVADCLVCLPLAS